MDPREWLFINSELTVHLYRDPTGEWMALDAETAIGPTGVGTAFTVLHDESGPVAVARRPCWSARGVRRSRRSA